MAVILDRKLYLNTDKTRLVEEGDPAAAYVFGTIGTEISQAEADRLGYTPKLSEHERFNAAVVHAATHGAQLPDAVLAAGRASGEALPAIPPPPPLLEQNMEKVRAGAAAQDAEDAAEQLAADARADATLDRDPADLPPETIEERQETERADDAEESADTAESGDAEEKALDQPPATKAMKGPPAKK